MPLITYDNKVTAQTSPLPAEEKWVSADANEVKEVVNDIITNVGLLKSDGTDVTAAVAGTDYLAPGAAVTAVTGTAPIAATVGTTPAISLNDSGVTAAAYTVNGQPLFTVTAKGLISAASNAVVSAAAAGPDTSMQFNDGGAIAGDPSLTYDVAAAELRMEGNGADAVLVVGGTTSDISEVRGEGTGGMMVRTTVGFLTVSAATQLQIDGTDNLLLASASTPRLNILADGTWEVEGSAGTAGQVLTSAGAGAAPGWADASPGVYEAALTQTGTDDPTAVVFTNTTGRTISWTRLSTGYYRGTISSPVNPSLCGVLMGAVYNDDMTAFVRVSGSYIPTTTTVDVWTGVVETDGAATSLSNFSDGLLIGTIIRLLLQ